MGIRSVVSDRWQRLRDAGRERGAGALEYAAATALAAVMVGSVALTANNGQIGAVIPEAVCQVQKAAKFGSCTAPTPTTPPSTNPPLDPKPPKCRVSRKSEKVNGVVKIGIFKFGENAGFVETVYSDGTVTYTVTDGATIGLETGFGGKFDIGKVKAGAKVDFGGGLKFDYGSTWTFANQDEADAMRTQLDDYLLQQQTLKRDDSGGYALYLTLFDKWVDPPKPPNQSVSTVTLEGDIGARVGIVPPWAKKPKEGDPPPKPGTKPNINLANGGLKFGGSGKWTTVHDSTTGNTTYTTSGEGYGSFVGQLGPVDGEGRALYGQDVSITRDKNGKVVKIEFTTTRESSLNGKGKIGTGKGNASGSKKSANAEVVTTTLNVETDAQRAVVDDWINNDGRLNDARLNPDRPDSSDPFQMLLYNNAQVSTVQYNNITDTTGFAAEVKLGLTLGVDFSLETATSRAVSASYLGLPDAGGVRQPVDNPECVSK